MLKTKGKFKKTQAQNKHKQYVITTERERIKITEIGHIYQAPAMQRSAFHREAVLLLLCFLFPCSCEASETWSCVFCSCSYPNPLFSFLLILCLGHLKKHDLLFPLLVTPLKFNCTNFPPSPYSPSIQSEGIFYFPLVTDAIRTLFFFLCCFSCIFIAESSHYILYSCISINLSSTSTYLTPFMSVSLQSPWLPNFIPWQIP